eukprot:15482173-Alexandrium_andersonii.AAC.1
MNRVQCGLAPRAPGSGSTSAIAAGESSCLTRGVRAQGARGTEAFRIAAGRSWRVQLYDAGRRNYVPREPRQPRAVSARHGADESLRSTQRQRTLRRPLPERPGREQEKEPTRGSRECKVQHRRVRPRGCRNVRGRG